MYDRKTIVMCIIYLILPYSILARKHVVCSRCRQFWPSTSCKSAPIYGMITPLITIKITGRQGYCCSAEACVSAFRLMSNAERVRKFRAGKPSVEKKKITWWVIWCRTEISCMNWCAKKAQKFGGFLKWGGGSGEAGKLKLARFAGLWPLTILWKKWTRTGGSLGRKTNESGWESFLPPSQSPRYESLLGGSLHFQVGQWSKGIFGWGISTKLWMRNIYKAAMNLVFSRLSKIGNVKNIHTHVHIYWLVVWLPFFIFPLILGF